MREIYQSFRTWRRMPDTRSIEMNVGEKDIDTVNIWNQVEHTKGRIYNQPMKHDYTQIEFVTAPFKCTSKQLSPSITILSDYNDEKI